VRTAYKCRAYPDAGQQQMLSRTFGCVRVVWNRTLAWRRQRYHGEHAKTGFTQASAYLTAMKATGELAWLNEVPSVPLQQAIRHQQVAFTSFFAGRARYPRYKSRQGRQSAEYTRSGFRYRDGKLTLAKTGTPLTFIWSWPGIDPAGIDPSTVTVSRDPDGRWYVSLAVDTVGPAQLPATGSAVGVDLGIKDFAVLSTGEKIANPRHLERKARNLARYQRRAARCQQGSANRSLARAISDCGWGTFRQMTEYKAARYGRHVIVIDRWYPSSKTCSACGHLLAELSLKTRTWQCPSSGTRHDRDVNAAKNILAAGLAVGTGNGAHACGADVRPQGTPLRQPAVKQEPPGASPGIPVHQGGE
jgi:putative transposase